ncbi:MAG: DUF2254 family protein, partial [Weeksellaceae bacterium]|nr:DUF2254 family protein [Weeksellaceae bacterium]
LSSYINQEFPSPFRADEQNNLRLIFKTIDFNAIVDTSFNQIRQFGANSPAVIIHLMQSVQLLLEMSYTDRNDEILLAHARKIMETAEKSFVNTHDLTDLQEVYLRII